MRKPLAVGAATIAVALSLGLAACGSDDSDEGLTKAEVIEQADAVCLDYTEQLAEIVSNLDPQATQADAEALVTDEIVPLYEQEIEELRAIEPNSDDEAAYTEMLDTLESELQAIEDDPSRITSGDTAFPEATKMAQEFGLTECGSGEPS